MNRFYHSVNTRYNIHFNAEEAYKEALRMQNENREDNLSEMLYVFPDKSDSTSMQSGGGSFTTTIDKATKAIKLHSIKTKPRRDPDRRNDAEYQAWLQQKEYTPFMDKVWLLLAKAEFYDGNYLRAITIFMYISKIYGSRPEIVTECHLWVARAYSEMGWMYEAGNVLHKLELAGGVSEKQKAFYSEVKANYLIRSNEYRDAIPHLEYAIKKEKEKTQKLRMKYLLGQLYEDIGDKTKAYQAFGNIKGMSTPYKYTFNAKLQQLQLDTSKGERNLVAELEKMGKKSRNEEYHDQIYYTIGNIYLNNLDSAKAIGSYHKAVESSKRNGYDKMLSEIKLADIYFDQREFVPAQPLYASALTQIKKANPAYSRVSTRSDVLDELVVHVKTLHEQDSLQYLARLPEAERLQIINAKIEELKKQEEERIRLEEREKQKEERETRTISSWSDLGMAVESGNKTRTQNQQNTSVNNQTSFYFYNEQAVNQGKIAFQKQWGSRKLEDDWRRSSKFGFSSDLAELVDDQKEADKSLLDEKEEGEKEAIDDIYSVEYYLQQLPLTETAIEQSNVLIENALFNMGKIYKDKLHDMDLAVNTFNTDIERFPQTPNLEEIYYQLLLIYMQTGDRNMMANYRNRLLSEFSQGKYATPLSDANYEWNFRHLPILQDSLYTAAYDAYMQANVETVRGNYKEMNDKYPFTDLMPKFAFLNALSYAQTRDIKGLETNLTELTNQYPKADVTPLATDILGRIKEGKIILSDGTPILEFDWSKAYLAENELLTEDGEVLAFSEDLDKEYLLLLMFKSNTVDRNELLYEVADYNFSNYVIQTFDLSFDTDASYDVLQIKGFAGFPAIKSYLDKALGANGLLSNIDENIVAVPISVNNYVNVLPRMGMEQYTSFFSKEFDVLLPKLIAYWDKNKDDIDDLSEIPDLAENINNQQKEETTKEAKEVEERQKNRPIEEKKEEEKQPVVNEKQITADDLLTKEQLETVGKVSDVLEDVGDILDNPVDGIKNLFNRNKYKDNLTKEEKEALKLEEKLEKERQKELKAVEKVRQDSINKLEKSMRDSISKAEKAVKDSIKAIEKEKEEQRKLEEQRKKDAEKAVIKAKEDATKQKENERKEKEHLQKERLSQQEQERKEKEKARETERKEKERQQKERLKQREQERKEKEKAQEKARKEKEKEAEEKRKQRNK
jgi:tetratricopeptide (TPR) repeat protein